MDDICLIKTILINTLLNKWIYIYIYSPAGTQKLACATRENLLKPICCKWQSRRSRAHARQKNIHIAWNAFSSRDDEKVRENLRRAREMKKREPRGSEKRERERAGTGKKAGLSVWCVMQMIKMIFCRGMMRRHDVCLSAANVGEL